MEETKYCPHCGKQIKKEALKCIHCKQWIDGKTHQSIGTGSTSDGVSSSGSNSAGKVIFAVFAVLVLSAIIYALVSSGKKDKSESTQIEYYDRQSSSSESRYGNSDGYSSKSFSEKTCPTCGGSGELDGSTCEVCEGFGKLRYREGACKRGCGCQVYIASLGHSFCINCLLTFDCNSDESGHY